MKWPSRIAQLAPQIARHDAIGNEVFALHAFFRRLGIQSEIYCDLADAASRPHVRAWEKVSRFKGSLLFVHFSHGAPGLARVCEMGVPFVLIYHGSTPPDYFRGTNPLLEQASREGEKQLAELAQRACLCVAHSSFTARRLEEAGSRHTLVLPYVLNEALYSAGGDPKIEKLYGGDGWVNILTVGRITPNKRCEDCIFIYDYYKRYIEPKSRLFLVGDIQGMECYRERLEHLLAELGLRDVYFTGAVSQRVLVSYYRIATAYISMSEHEGFGVPLVEAMRFGVPVFALAASAVAETLRGAGLLFREKSWPVIAEAIGLVLNDHAALEQILSEQREAVAHYSAEKAEGRLRALLQRIAEQLGESC